MDLIEWTKQVLRNNEIGLEVDTFLRSQERIWWIDRHVDVPAVNTTDTSSVVDGACSVGVALLMNWHKAILAGLPVRASKPTLVVDRSWLSRLETPPHVYLTLARRDEVPEQSFFCDATQADLRTMPSALAALASEYGLEVMWLADIDEPEQGAWLLMCASDPGEWRSSEGTLWHEAR
jgi:hypothetical protein